jgi:hypothetical protein
MYLLSVHSSLSYPTPPHQPSLTILTPHPYISPPPPPLNSLPTSSHPPPPPPLSLPPPPTPPPHPRTTPPGNATLTADSRSLARPSPRASQTHSASPVHYSYIPLQEYLPLLLINPYTILNHISNHTLSHLTITPTSPLLHLHYYPPPPPPLPPLLFLTYPHSYPFTPSPPPNHYLPSPPPPPNIPPPLPLPPLQPPHTTPNPTNPQTKTIRPPPYPQTQPKTHPHYPTSYLVPPLVPLTFPPTSPRGIRKIPDGSEAGVQSVTFAASGAVTSRPVEERPKKMKAIAIRNTNVG